MARSIRALVFVLVLLRMGYAEASILTANYALNFVPPNPCDATSVGGNPLGGATLGGVIDLFVGVPARTSAAASTRFGGLACGASLSLPAIQIPNLIVADMTPVYLQFAGTLVSGNPGPPTVPLFAFDDGTAAVAALPTSAPSILLGWLALSPGSRTLSFVGGHPGPPNLPLFAFASPGVAIGTLAVRIAVVPEPATLALLAAGLAVLVLRRRFAA